MHRSLLRPFLSSLGTGVDLRLDAPLNRLTDSVLT
jgi:hypothetical protein